MQQKYCRLHKGVQGSTILLEGVSSTRGMIEGSTKKSMPKIGFHHSTREVYRAFQNKPTSRVLLCRTQLLFKLKDIYTEYPPNTQVCIPKKYLADFGRSAKFFDFSIFFFFLSKKKYYSLFSGKTIFGEFFRYPGDV